MSSEFRKESLISSVEKERIKCEKSIETEITLPDYCKDIKRILKCTLTPGIHSVSTASDKVSVKGTALIRLIYAGDKEQIDCYEKTVDISLSGQFRQLDADTLITAHAVTDYINCRALSQRKVSINGSISVILKAIAKEETVIPFDVGKGIETKKEKQTEECLVCHTEKTFDLGEAVALGKDKASIGKILRHHAYINIESQKAVADKMLLKGEMVVRVVYCPADSENRTQTLVHTMPVSQIIDIEGIDESCEIRSDCKVSQLLINVKSDSSEAGRIVEIAARVCCHISAYRLKEYEYISDCYCTEGKHTAEYSGREILTPIYSAEKVLTLRQSTELTSLKDICDLWVSDIQTDMQGSEDKAKGRIILTLCALYLDENGLPTYAEKELEFLSDISLKQACEEIKCDFSAEVRTVKGTVEKEGTMEMTADVAVKIRVYGVKHSRYVSKINEAPEGAGKVYKPALTLCFCQKGESVWDIAKKYSTTVKAIKEENSLESDRLAKDCMLLIPCV